ncbi:MAG: LPS assembly protein LptD [Burkholderiaceae bacterium]
MLVAIVLCMLGAWPLAAAAQSIGAAAADEPLTLRPSLQLAPPASGTAGRRSIVLQAKTLRARPDLDAEAEGDVEFRHAGTVVRADRFVYDYAEDRMLARGQVQISRDGNVYRGPELQLQVQRFEGFFLKPEFQLGRNGAGGRAERVDFVDASRSTAWNATYTSCPRDGSGDPDWLLSADRVRLDLEDNEGIADGAVLRFLGVPILGMPVMSFPLTDQRKSGWLPPDLNIDNRSGVELAVPYYWNIAPNRDATLTPVVSTRRGAGLGAEFRYLERNDEGVAGVHWLPHDSVEGRSRSLTTLTHDGQTDGGLHYGALIVRASDDNYWKDFPRYNKTITPRLLPLALLAERSGEALGIDYRLYAGARRWQVLQSSDPAAAIVSPYDRLWQGGLRVQSDVPGGLKVALETEANRFVRPLDDRSFVLPEGTRVHAIASLTKSWETPGWWVRPKFSANAAAYQVDQPMSDGRTRASRVIPTFSLDIGAAFERDSHWFGRDQRQTLEPRLLYVNTPPRAQATLPNFDASGYDFNLVSIYSENAFTGIDRVSDAHQLTAGATTRLIDPATGAETLRLGIAQRYLFRDQQVTPDGVPLTQRLSDVLIEGSTTLVPNWQFDVALQYSAEINRAVRSITGVRYVPAPFHALSATYRLARGLSEQMELGWQWPVYRGSGAQGGGRCQGSLYAVGRVNYSMRDSRITDSIGGFEYDAGCWIARVVAERLSTGRSEATTRFLLQLELVGLSRIGSSPLQVLKDNIPGYRLLREERSPPATAIPND